MIELNVHYRPVRFLKYKKKCTGWFPDKFEELTARQLIAVASLRNCSVSEVAFLHIMTGFEHHVIRKLDQYERYKLMELFSVFNAIHPFHDFIIKTINQHGTKLYAPRPKLKAVTFAQFIFADTWFGNYNESNKTEDLHCFVASLYLQENCRFHENQIEQNIAIVKNVDREILEAIAINYILIREWLGIAYPLIFSPVSDTKSEDSNPKKFDSGAWIKIFESLVGDDIVNEDKYADKPVHNIFRYMSARIKENMKRKN